MDSIDVALPQSVSQEATPGVTGNDKPLAFDWTPPLAALTTDQLKDARWLPLSAIPVSSRSAALVADVVALVARHEAETGARRRGRGEAGLARQQQAVGAIIGGVLRRWGREEPKAVFRSRKKDDFTGGPVAARPYLFACDALVSLGLLHQSRSIRYGKGIWRDGEPELFFGNAPRLWPAPALVDIAARHGVIPATLDDDFGDAYPTQPPAVPALVQMFTLKQPRRTEKAEIAIRDDDPQAVRFRLEVENHNEWVAQHGTGGCLPPRFKRVFTGSWLLGGRWYACGHEGNYQQMAEAERLAITVNGESVLEADVRASHLSIMHGLLGLPLPDGDPYVFPGVPRSVVKAWITAALGKGSPVTRWAPKAAKDIPETAQYDARSVGRVIIERYPFLRAPAQAVAHAAGLDKLAHLGPPERLLTHRLMAIEAAARTGAMSVLRSRGILALPMHDGLLVPVTRAGYVGGALDSAYGYFAKIRWKVTPTPEVARA